MEATILHKQVNSNFVGPNGGLFIIAMVAGVKVTATIDVPNHQDTICLSPARFLDRPVDLTGSEMGKVALKAIKEAL